MEVSSEINLNADGSELVEACQVVVDVLAALLEVGVEMLLHNIDQPHSAWTVASDYPNTELVANILRDGDFEVNLISLTGGSVGKV